MRIGVVREIKAAESRVALVPQGAGALTKVGHEVVVETGAGEASGFTDDDYAHSGATVVDADGAWSSDLVLKVKEPQPQEYSSLGQQCLFTFLHLAANPDLAAALVAAGTTALSYDTARTERGEMPLLTPMSAIAGVLAVNEGAHHLLTPSGGSGMLLGGIPGLAGGSVVVIGAGVVGSHAAAQALALGASVTVLDVAAAPLERLLAANDHHPRLRTHESTPESVAAAVAAADLVVGAVLVPGRRAPVVVTRDMIHAMRQGSVVVDIAIDQGGCTEVSRPTSHTDPVFTEGPALISCVPNMPAAAGRTATLALTQATIPYVMELASGIVPACQNNVVLAQAVNVAAGRIVHPAIAEAFPDLPYDPEGLGLTTG